LILNARRKKLTNERPAYQGPVFFFFPRLRLGLIPLCAILIYLSKPVDADFLPD
jgi:hypothetical protein